MEKNIIKICFPLMLALTASNCTKDFPALNVNPNQVTNVPYKALLTNSINSVSRAYYTNIYCDNRSKQTLIKLSMIMHLFSVFFYS